VRQAPSSHRGRRAALGVAPFPRARRVGPFGIPHLQGFVRHAALGTPLGTPDPLSDHQLPSEIARSVARSVSPFSSRRTGAESPCAAILWPWMQFTRGSSPAATVEGARRPLRIALTTA
jgi:hypothetical protein